MFFPLLLQQKFKYHTKPPKIKHTLHSLNHSFAQQIFILFLCKTKMKVKTPSLLKKIIAALSNKTKDLRIRIMIFFLLHKNIDKSSLTHSLHSLVSQPLFHHHSHNHVVDEDVLLQHYTDNSPQDCLLEEEQEKNEDLTNSILRELEEEMEEEEAEEEEVVVVGGCEMAAETVEEEGEDINQAADMFIQRFRRQIQMQKQLSLERHHPSLLLSNA